MKFILLLCFICSSFLVSAQTIFARNNGDWDIPATWSTTATGGPSCGCTPVAGDDVLIDGYDVDIDAGTGDVTVNSIQITNTRGSDVRLRVQDGSTLTVTTNFEIESNSAGDDAELTIEDTDSQLDISGNFPADQDDGDDLLIDIDDNGQVNISGNAQFLQDGGDDMELNLNLNSGTSAQFNVTGNVTFDHDGGDDIRVLVDDASSLIDVDGSWTVSMNDGTDDDYTFNMDGGDIDVAGDISITRAGDYGPVDFDMDGGNLNCDDITINSSGALFTLGAVRFFIDGSSRIDCNSLDVSFTGADDFYIHINENSGTSGVFDITNDFTLNRSNGDDIEIIVNQDNSRLLVGGDVSISTSGGEEFDIEIDNNGEWDTDGDFDITVTNSDDAQLDMAGGADEPVFSVGVDFTWLNQTGDVDCFIDVNGGTFTVGNDMTLTNASGADDLDIDVDEDGRLMVLGDFLAQITGGDDIRIGIGENTSPSTAMMMVTGNAFFLLSSAAGSNPIWRLRIYDDGNFIVGGELDLTSDFTSTGLCLVDLQDDGELSVTGDIDLNAIGSGELEIRMIDDSFVRIGGDFLRGASPNNFGELDASTGNATVEYMGTGSQVIAEDAGGGGDSFFYMNLEIDNSFGTIPQLSLEGVATVHGDLTMNDGVVESDLTDLLIVDDNATTSNASDNSYVDGYMRKVGNDAFTFPVGDGGFYGPIGMTAPGSAADQFEAQYVYVTPHNDGFDSSMHDASVSYISRVEYWRMTRSSGSSTPTISLSWDTPRSGGVGDENDLRFMRWDGSSWRDLGAAGITGTPTSGTLDNNTGITAFADGNPYTLGTIDLINPLPIELVSFNAVLNEDVVNLYWTTKSEINNAFFTLQRSRDGLVWEHLNTIEGAGNSSVEINYTDIDREPYSGISYYRIGQTDFDGTMEWFTPVAVNRMVDFLVYPNPAQNEFYVLTESLKNQQISLYDLSGKQMQVDIQTLENGLQVVSTRNLASGKYYLRIQNDLSVQVQSVMVLH